MLIKESEVEELKSKMSKVRIGKANKFLTNGYVEIYYIEFGWDYDRITVNARIMDGNNYVRTSIDFSISHKIILWKECNADYFSTECEHTLALAFALSKDPEIEKQILKIIQKKQEEKQQEDFNNLINSFSSMQEEEEIKYEKEDGIDIIPVLVKQNAEYELSFKIGKKKMYKIKSITEFGRTLKSKENIYFGEQLHYINEEQAYTDNAKAYIKWIARYGETIKYATDMADRKANYHLKIPDSKIMLDENNVEDFMECFKNSNHKIEINKEKTTLEIENGDPKIQFGITKDNNKYNFKIKGKVPDILRGNIKSYIIEKSKIIEFDTKMYKNLLTLLDVYDSYIGKYIFDDKGLKVFVENIMTKIPKGIDISELPQDDIEKYIPKKLSVKMKLDINKSGYIENNILFCYGDFEFNPFGVNNITIPRNDKEEKRIISEIEYDGFVYSEKSYNMVLLDEEKTYEFLNEKIDDYMAKYEVLISEDFKKKQVLQPKIGTIGVKIKNDLLNIDLSEINYDPKELEGIMEQYRLKKKYYKLKDGSFLKLEQNENMDFLDKLVEGMDMDFKKLDNGEIKLPVNRSLYLNRLLEKNPEIQVKEDKEYKKLVEDTTNSSNDEEILIPNDMDKILRDYQKTGYKWLKVLDKYKFGGILADDMGLGKTLQVISLLQTQEKGETSIVVCPSSLSLNWKNEITKFANSIRACVIRGIAQERTELIKNAKQFEVIITSYDLLKRDIEIYDQEKLNFRYIIADEAQYIKNSNTQNAKALKSLEGKTKFALTGTPIENSLAELWSIFDYIMPGYLFGYSKFKKQFETEIVKNNNEEKMQKLKTMIEPFILRRTKKQVLTELPDKTITVLNNEMEGQQQKIYLAYMAKAKKEIMQTIKDEGFEKSQIKILSILTRLRQICCHPGLFIENYDGESSKLNQCVEIIEDAIYADHKILLFSNYTQMFPLIEKELDKRFIQYYKLTGETKIEERITLVDDFNKNKDVKVFLISLKAGGTGLNLTGADMVIHYDPWWNLSAENQATDRAYRIGQKNNVQVYKLITTNSIEEKIQELQEKKAELVDNVLDTKQTFISKLSKDEIMSLFEE